MIKFILGLFIILIAIILPIFIAPKDNKLIRVGARIIALILGIGIMGMSVVSYVPTGYTGILVSFGKVENTTLNFGVNFVLPWKNIVLMDNREQRSNFSTASFSADIQEVDVSGSINYNIDKQTAMILYSTVGMNYNATLIEPRLLENLKSIVSKYTAEQLVSNRGVLSDEVRALMVEGLRDYGINIISVAISNIDFTDAFTNAIEAKQVATQELQHAQIQEQQKTMEARQSAERKKIDADAAAEVAKIQADADAYAIERKAEAEANANRQIAESLTTELIDYSKIQTWDGKLPTTVLGSETSLIVDFEN